MRPQGDNPFSSFVILLFLVAGGLVTVGMIFWALLSWIFGWDTDPYAPYRK